MKGREVASWGWGEDLSWSGRDGLVDSEDGDVPDCAECYLR